VKLQTPAVTGVTLKLPVVAAGAAATAVPPDVHAETLNPPTFPAWLAVTGRAAAAPTASKLRLPGVTTTCPAATELLVAVGDALGALLAAVVGALLGAVVGPLLGAALGPGVGLVPVTGVADVCGVGVAATPIVLATGTGPDEPVEPPPPQAVRTMAAVAVSTRKKRNVEASQTTELMRHLHGHRYAMMTDAAVQRHEAFVRRLQDIRRPAALPGRRPTARLLLRHDSRRDGDGEARA
jgi:hypothetical protein